MIKRKWPILLAIIVILGLGFFFYFNNSKMQTYNWGINYKHTSKTPYGNKLLYDLMQSMFKDKSFRTISEPLKYNREFNNVDSGQGIYFFSGQQFYPDRSTVASLKNFIENGNQVFIASTEISSFFLDSIINPYNMNNNLEYNILNSTPCVKFNPGFIHPDLIKLKRPTILFKTFGVITNTNVGYFSHYFFDSLFGRNDQIDYYRIGNFNTPYFNGLNNFIKINVGSGSVYLYSTPLVLTNYYLRKQEVFEYAKGIFMHLKPATIYWHENTYLESDADNTDQNKAESPFATLLNYKSLKYAWYTFLLAILLFCIISFKRRQRPIRVLEKNSNTSIQFAETITKLYLAEGNHKYIAVQKFQYFFNYVRSKYGINLQNNLNSDKVKLSKLSQVPEEQIEGIMFCYNQLQALPNATADELNNLVTRINAFYSSTK